MADDLIPYLDEDDLDRISRLLEAWESGRLNPSIIPPPMTPDSAPVETRLAKATSDISARSGTLPGTGTATMYGLPGSHLTSTGLPDITVYNLYDAIADGSWLVLARDPVGGQYFVVLIPAVPKLSVGPNGTDVNGLTLYGGPTSGIYADSPLEFWQDPATGTVHMKCLDASILNSGIVNQTTQKFTGDKWFDNIVPGAIHFGHVTFFGDHTPHCKIYGVHNVDGPYIQLETENYQTGTGGGHIDSTSSLTFKTSPILVSSGPVGWAICDISNTGGNWAGPGATTNPACAAFSVGGTYGVSGDDWIGTTFKGGICVNLGTGPTGIDGGSW